LEEFKRSSGPFGGADLGEIPEEVAQVPLRVKRPRLAQLFDEQITLSREQMFLGVGEGVISSENRVQVIEDALEIIKGPITIQDEALWRSAYGQHEVKCSRNVPLRDDYDVGGVPWDEAGVPVREFTWDIEEESSSGSLSRDSIDLVATRRPKRSSANRDDTINAKVPSNSSPIPSSSLHPYSCGKSLSFLEYHNRFDWTLMG